DCNKSFHGKCVNLSADDVNYLLDQGDVWRCTPCSQLRRKSMVLESKSTVTYDDIFKLVNELKEDIKRVETSLGTSLNSCHEELAETKKSTGPEGGNHETDFQDKPFVEYLKSKKLTPNLIHYVLYAIAMSSEQTPCMEGVERTQRFLNSLGRYGNTPFLWPMYGSGELPQCFCRLCAVFGGVYYLKRATHGVIVAASDGGKCTGIVSSQQRLSTQHLVMGLTSAPKQFLKAAPTQGLSRGIFLIDRSILPAEKETLTLLQFPPCEGSPEPITVVEVGPSTNACPQGLFVVHMTCKQQKSAEEDLAVAVSKLFHLEYCDGTVDRIDTDTQATQTAKTEPCEGSEEADGASQDTARHKPQLLWSLYFNCPETNSCQLSADVPANVHLCCSGPDLDLDFEYAVKQAKEIFTKMYPDSEFLPRAPDPEEIVLEDDEAPGPAFKAESEDINEENK
ncbi:rab proteins geranylgeranyltransferase component A 2-like, partial [Nilaparvata lugens]|uniref:rab proteins geranylgeranyltransferase component A 2-like n=1 Tax=Nilaparvata lugens TaxID=108931 RepID=UPI00193E5D6A